MNHATVDRIVPPSKWTRPLVLLVLAAGAAVVLSGCGPVESTVGISDAEAELQRAETHDADVYSPYEYYRAEHFLYKAKEEWGYSNFEAARDYATVAQRAARAAYNNAREVPWEGHPVYGFDDFPDDIERLQRDLEGADDFDDMDRIDDE